MSLCAKPQALTAGCLLIVLVFLATGCGANDTVLRSGKETPARGYTAPEKSSFVVDLESLHTAKFTFIFALRRQDASPLDADDRAAIRVQTADANRRISTDEGRAVLVGSNYLLPAANIAALRERFVFEDYSPTPALDPNGNANK